MTTIATTTIRISENNKDILEQLKIHPRETYNDILTRILEMVSK